MRHIIAAFLLVSGNALHAQSASPEITSEIIDASVRFLHDTDYFTGKGQPKITFKLDATVFSAGNVFSVGNMALPQLDQSGRQHPVEIFSKVRSFGGATIVSPERAIQCEKHAPSECMTNGGSIVLRFANPVITSDSGYVEVWYRGSAAVSAADSAKISRTTLALKRASMGVYRLHVARTSDAWSVTRVVVRGVT